MNRAPRTLRTAIQQHVDSSQCGLRGVRILDVHQHREHGDQFIQGSASSESAAVILGSTPDQIEASFFKQSIYCIPFSRSLPQNYSKPRTLIAVSGYTFGPLDSLPSNTLLT